MRIANASLAGVLAAVLLLAGCGATEHRTETAPRIHVNEASSIGAWARTAGPIRLVLTREPRVHDLRQLRAVIINSSSRAYQTGGCSSWDRWPDTSVTTLSCL